MKKTYKFILALLGILTAYILFNIVGCYYLDISLSKNIEASKVPIDVVFVT